MADRDKRKVEKSKKISRQIAGTPKPESVEQIDPRTKRIKVKKIEPQFVITNTGSNEAMEDAAKIEGKPHSSPEGQFESKMRARPLEIRMANGGKVRLAKKGGGRAYGQNS